MSERGALERLRDWHAHTAIILGSGLNSLVREASNDRVIAYSEFDELPTLTVPGHVGRFILGEIGTTRVIYAQGRVHLYEGRSGRKVTAGVRLLASAGVKQLILTNSGGTANKEFLPGSWMMITDHINLTGATPLLGKASFVDMTGAYSEVLRVRFARAARSNNIVLHQGIYAGLLGPQYETPAEVCMLRQLGADAIGMSTVLEVIQARALGLEVGGFSCLTNWAAGIGTKALSHAEVLEKGEAAAETFARLLHAAL